MFLTILALKFEVIRLSKIRIASNRLINRNQ